MIDRPVVVAVASYHSKASADADFSAVRDGARPSRPARLAIALMEKGADGRLTADRHLCAEAGPAWDGAVLGGALAVLAPPLGIAFLVAVAHSPAVLGGVAAIAGKFWHELTKHELRRMSELIEVGQASLLVVAGDDERAAIESRMAGADMMAVATVHADLTQAYLVGVEEACALG